MRSIHRVATALFVLALGLSVSGQGTNYARTPDTGIDWVARGVSMARYWNEAILFSIRRDLARPVVHARNLYHLSCAMWDAWSTYETKGTQMFYNIKTDTTGWTQTKIEEHRNISISFAAYHLLKYRYKFVPKTSLDLIQGELDKRMTALGHPLNWTITNANKDTPQSIGYAIATHIIEIHVNDGAFELNDYITGSYYPKNPPLAPALSSSINFVINPNKWQPIALGFFVDQNGVSLEESPPFTGPHWGLLPPFAMSNEDRVKDKPGLWFGLPGPAQLPWNPGNWGEDKTDTPITEEGNWYKNNHTFVAEASSWLDPDDGVMIDISPSSIGNNTLGTNDGHGYTVNPKTGKPYQKQVVKRGDYYRVLAEFWADGPFSEAPPGHWNVLLNYVSDHPEFARRWKGQGPVLDRLEWDVKSYLTMNGAMHDSAIAAWGAKGYYDSARPLTAIRFMGWKGQCNDTYAVNYNKYGFILKPGFVEQITRQTTRVGGRHEALAGKEGKIALYAWRGPKFINATEKGYAGVGWIAAEDWWPYQRPNFVTPPFAGYVSGHSTYSRAAAEVMTAITGDKFFPGGLSRFLAPKNNFLVFEKGPSMDIELQWATYYDAADECSLSRIWGGIHPRMDDYPGRFMGSKIGIKAVNQSSYVFGEIRPASVNLLAVGAFILVAILVIAIGIGFYAFVKFRPLAFAGFLRRIVPNMKYTRAETQALDEELGDIHAETISDSDDVELQDPFFETEDENTKAQLAALRRQGAIE